MRQLLTLSLLLPSLAFGQALTGTAPEQRTVFLEDFTGIKCVYCPEGHTIMAGIAAAHPGLVSLVGVHAGSFAVPSTGQPDFRTTAGTAINNFFGVSGYPSGVINRHSFSGTTVLSRNAWAEASSQILTMPSPVNLGMESSFDQDTRELTAHVQLYYTADSPGGEDRISVLIAENNITGFQVTPQGNNANYNHTHVMRAYITGTWGDGVTTTAAGTTVDRTYTYTVPVEWNIANCDVTAFVGEIQSDVYQARTVAADGGATQVAGALAAVAGAFQAGSSGTGNHFPTTFQNLVGDNAEFTVNIEAMEAPASWGASLQVDGNTMASGSVITVADGATVQLSATITPDNTPGIGNYRIFLTSVDFPDAAAMVQEVHVISGVHDLIVANPDAEQWNSRYTMAMDQAGELAYAKTSRDAFIRFGQADALGGVLNIYRNVSWTFPSITDEEVALLSTFMDNGGNLMIAGQDIGWDQSGASSAYGTAATQSFYTNYMLATYVNDGSPSNNQVVFNTGDPVFGGVSNSAVANVFGSGNTYPDEITPIAPASAILTYNTTPKIGGLRAQTANYKLVYFGVGPEQMGNQAVGRSMVQLSHDWFYGIVGIAEFDAAMAALGQAYPVPADAVLHIPVNALPGDAMLQVFDAMGRLVAEKPAAGAPEVLQVNTSGLANGVYSYRLRTTASAGPARSFTVAH